VARRRAGAERLLLSNLPETENRERLARLARLRWTIEFDYRQLKGELGLDHDEGRSYAGFHDHCALVVTCAHAFLARACLRALGEQRTMGGRWSSRSGCRSFVPIAATERVFSPVARLRRSLRSPRSRPRQARSCSSA
jgi:hypothetical protein